MTYLNKEDIVMKNALQLLAPVLIGLLLITGCAKTEISKRHEYTGKKIPRPGNILVYDFVATPEDLHEDSAIGDHHTAHETPQTSQQINEGKKLGVELAKELVKNIQEMGMPAEHTTSKTAPQVNDLVIRGSLLSIIEESSGKHFFVGFGSGASEMVAAVEGFQMTDQGLRKLGSSDLDATDKKSPGAVVPLVVAAKSGNPLGLIVSTVVKSHREKTGASKLEGRDRQTAKEISDQLKIKFQQQGWIE
jgi:hypothetical protein